MGQPGSQPGGALVVDGGAYVGKGLIIHEDLTVHGNLMVEGERVEVNTATLIIEDSIFELGTGIQDSTADSRPIIGFYNKFNNDESEPHYTGLIGDVHEDTYYLINTNQGTGSIGIRNDFTELINNETALTPSAPMALSGLSNLSLKKITIFNNETATSSGAAGALKVEGGGYFGGNLIVNNAAEFGGDLIITATTEIGTSSCSEKV